MIQRLALILLVFAVVAVAPFGSTARRQLIRPLERSDNGFRLKALDGKVYDTAATGGDVWVVSFGATWCTPCTWELVAIEELKEEYDKKPVRFLWVSIEDTRRTSNALLKHYAKERGLTIPVLRDPNGEVLTQFSQGTRIPVVVFFDRDGKYVAPIHRGMSSEISDYKRMVRTRVDRLLSTRTNDTSGREK